MLKRDRDFMRTLFCILWSCIPFKQLTNILVLFHSNRFIPGQTAVISNDHESLFCLSISPGGCLPRKIGNVVDLPRICVYRGLLLDLALPSSTGSGWHRKLLSSRSSSSQFTRSLVRPSYWYRSSETQRCEGKTQIRGKSFLKGQVTDPQLLILL